MNLEDASRFEPVEQLGATAGPVQPMRRVAGRRALNKQEKPIARMDRQNIREAEQIEAGRQVCVHEPTVSAVQLRRSQKAVCRANST